MNDITEVCPLSCRIMLQPVSQPLQQGICFLRIPLPAYPPRQQRSLRFACRHRQRNGLTLFRMNFRVGRSLPLRRRFVVHGSPVFKDHLTAYRFVQACQHVWLVKNHDVYQKFTYVGRTHSFLAPLRLRAARFRLASRLCVPVIRRLRCPQSFTPSCYRLRMSG